MSRTIEQQLRYMVANGNAMGQSKRAAKFDGGTKEKLFSVESYERVDKTAKMFGRFLRENYPEIRMAYAIKQEHVQKFLDEKTKTCNSNTMVKIRSSVRKLEDLAKNAYRKAKIDWGTVDVKIPDFKKGEIGKSIDFVLGKVIAEEMKKTGRSEAWRAFDVGRSVGLRVGEAVKLTPDRVVLDRPDHPADRWGFGFVWVPSLKLDGLDGGAKGDRARFVGIPTAEARQTIVNAIEGMEPGKPLAPSSHSGGFMTKENLNRRIADAMERLGIAMDYENDKMHATRRGWSQAVYDQVRREGGDRHEAKEVVNELLGHSGNREVIERYVANMW